MRTRLKTKRFPKITKDQFQEYVRENLEALKSKNKYLTEEILMKHYEDFNTDFRNLNNFILEFKGDYDRNHYLILLYLHYYCFIILETKKELVIKERAALERIFNMKTSGSYENRLLNDLFNEKVIDSAYFKSHIEHQAEIYAALNYLIREKLVRKTSSNSETYYELHSPKYRVALSVLKEDEGIKQKYILKLK